MSNKPFPFSVCKECCTTGGGESGGSVVVDDFLDIDSENPVQNKVVARALDVSVSTFIIENEGAENEDIQSKNSQGAIIESNIPLVSRAYVDNAVGDIETALDNIITKYGLGGETA